MHNSSKPFRLRRCLGASCPWGVLAISLLASFVVGSAGNANERFTSLGARLLPVDDGVWLGAHPVTVAEFEAFAEDTGYTIPSPPFPQEPAHPVVNVSWQDAKRFCIWLTDQERASGHIAAEASYRLPTEAEWEQAAGLKSRGEGRSFEQSSLIYAWGDTWPPPQGVANFSEQLGIDPYPYTSPVGSFPPNSNGFFDLSGNVWEWCEDLFEGASELRVLKGGSWRMHRPTHLALNRRIGNTGDLRLPTYGFRLALQENPN